MDSVIRSHHIYKTVWTRGHDEREEAKQFDIYAVGVYKKSKDRRKCQWHMCQSNSHFYFKKSMRKTVPKFTLKYGEVDSWKMVQLPTLHTLCVERIKDLYRYSLTKPKKERALKLLKWTQSCLKLTLIIKSYKRSSTLVFLFSHIHLINALGAY